jgi:hypothetical protein
MAGTSRAYQQYCKVVASSSFCENEEIKAHTFFAYFFVWIIWGIFEVFSIKPIMFQNRI